MDSATTTKRVLSPQRRIKHRECQQAYKQSARGKQLRRLSAARRAERYKNDPQQKLRAAARSAVRAAIVAGSLIRLPCEVCGNPASQGHHTDYSKQLRVQWLCRSHHAAVHAAMARP